MKIIDDRQLKISKNWLVRFEQMVADLEAIEPKTAYTLANIKAASSQANEIRAEIAEYEQRAKV